MPHDVFVSYSTDDKPTADATCAALEHAAIRCWIAPRDVLPSQIWSEAIVDAINGSRLMIVVFSSHSNTSQQVLREVERAVSKGIPILPFRIERIEPSRSMEYFLATPHWLDAIDPPLELHIRRMVGVVQALLAGEVGLPPPEEPAPPPAEPLVELAPDEWVEPKSRFAQMIQRALRDR